MSKSSSPAPIVAAMPNSTAAAPPPATTLAPPPSSSTSLAPAAVSPTSSPPPTPVSPPPSKNSSSSSPPPTSVPSPSGNPPSPSHSPPPPSSPNSTSSSSTSRPPASSSSSAPASPPPPPPRTTSTAGATATPSLSLSSPPASSASSQISATAVIGVGVAGVLALIVISALLYCFCCRSKKRKQDYYGPPGDPPSHYKGSNHVPASDQQQCHSHSSRGSDVPINMPPPRPPPSVPPSSGPNTGSKSSFSCDELAKATNGFSKTNLLGQGGFGSVFKGTLTDGRIVAIKKLKAGGGQGEKEFQAEVEIISRVHHRHLVSLVGYCIADSQRLLVYDYVPNRTLEYHLHGKKHGPVMDWATRLKIACGAARGLAYLHEDCHPRIIHRDIKSSNILLDNNFEAQVSDFGLAKLTSDVNTHVTTRVMGTFGYLAPEYASSGKLTEKSDVFSFGVVLLELISGRKPVDQQFPQGEESLVEWARALLKEHVNREEDLDVIADPALNGSFNRKEMLQMTQMAAVCIRHSANKRPKMSQIVRALEDDASFSDLTRGLKPGHSSLYGSSYAISDHDNTSYTAEMRRFRRAALESQEFGSEYSENTIEGNVNPSASSNEYHTSKEVPRNMENAQSTSASHEFS